MHERKFYDGVEDQYPLLTREDEAALAKRIERGDLAAKERLINCNIRLVLKQAHKWHHSSMSYDDVVQEGLVGLIRATEKFDWRRGYKFSTYAMFWINQAIGRAFDDRVRLVRLPVNYSQMARKIRRVQEESAKDNGRPLTDEELYEAIPELRPVQLDAIRDFENEPVSLNLKLGEEGEGDELGTVIPDEQARVADVVVNAEARTYVRERVGQMKDPIKTMLILRFGLDGDEPMKLADLAETIGLSQSAVGKQIGDALAEMRQDEGWQLGRELVEQFE